jgi:hypothetical protein
LKIEVRKKKKMLIFITTVDVVLVPFSKTFPLNWDFSPNNIKRIVDPRQ